MRRSQNYLVRWDISCAIEFRRPEPCLSCIPSPLKNWGWKLFIGRGAEVKCSHMLHFEYIITFIRLAIEEIGIPYLRHTSRSGLQSVVESRTDWEKNHRSCENVSPLTLPNGKAECWHKNMTWKGSPRTLFHTHSRGEAVQIYCLLTTCLCS